METQEKYVPRLLKIYRDEIVPKMKDRFGCTNTYAVPRLMKISVNMGIGAGVADQKLVEKAAEELTRIAGQKAKICRAKKPISNFKIKKGSPIGCCVTLRRYRMYEFLDRLISVAIPRVRDFRGFSTHAFDGNGNYTFGLVEQNVFVEVELDKVTRTQGMNISIHTNAGNDEKARELLRFFGFPFK